MTSTYPPDPPAAAGDDAQRAPFSGRRFRLVDDDSS